MGNFKEYPAWSELAVKRYSNTWKCLIEQFYHQLWLLINQEPDIDFINRFIGHLQTNSFSNPMMFICKYLETSYKIEKPEIYYPDQIQRIEITISKLRGMIGEINFMVHTEIIFEQLEKIPIYYN